MFLGKHLEMNARVFVARKTDVADLPRLLRLKRGLEAAFLDHPIRVAVIHHFVKLPQVEVVGFQTPQAVLEALHGTGVIALAVLGHQENLLALALHGQRIAHPLLRAPVVVIPGVVKEGDPFFDRRMHDPDSFALLLDGSNVPASQAEDGDALLGPAQDTGRNAGGAG